MKLLRCCNSNNDGERGVRKTRVSYKNGRRVQDLKLVVVISVVLLLVGLAECGLPLSKPCGDVECQDSEYCRAVDHTCQSCKSICDKDSNNFDANRCFSDCQDYIHDERYLKYKELEDDVFILKIIVGVCVAVILLVVAILASFLVYFWKLLHPQEPGTPEEKKKKGSTKSATTTVELPTVYNNRYGVTTPTPENSPSSVVSSSPADTNISNFTSIVPPSYNGAGRAQSEASIARASPETVTTTLTSNASTLVGKQLNKMNGIAVSGGSPNKTTTPVVPTTRFRREPSESTLPDNCGYDNLSMSPLHHIPYSHHV